MYVCVLANKHEQMHGQTTIFSLLFPSKRPFKLQQWEQRNKICSNCTIHQNNLIHGKKINLKIFHFLVSMQWLFANYFVLFLCKSDCYYWYFGLSHFHLLFLWAPHYTKQELLKILPGMSEHASEQKNLSPLTGSNPRPSVQRSWCQLFHSHTDTEPQLL